MSPGTLTPALVSAVGVFTTTPDRDNNCLEFFDSSTNLLGRSCAQSPIWYIASDEVEFFGARTPGGTAFVDIVGPACFEADLLSFSLMPPDPADRIQSVIEMVSELEATEALNHGGATALRTKLTQALNALAEGPSGVPQAQDRLLKFTKDLQNMVPKKLAEHLATPLVDAAHAIWDQLNQF